jgi:nucleoside diphosphate kinase
MSDQLSYALLTPYSIRKSRTGGIISRLIARTGLDLVGARMFAPGAELVRRYAEGIVTDPDPRHRATQELLRAYVSHHLGPQQDPAANRCLVLLLRGPDAVAKVHDTVGHIARPRTSGETIRDTYGDYLVAPDGSTHYFEPAVLAPPDVSAAVRDLGLFAEFSDSDGGLLEGVAASGQSVERTLVLIKPDNFRFPNSRPGAVIDFFSRTGLFIIGFEVLQMSAAQAEAFYGPVLDALDKAFRAPAGTRARAALEREFGLSLPVELETDLAGLVGPLHARAHWENIIRFMAGRRPSECPPELREQPGTEKCIALVYEGTDAVRKIREVLGPTDPSKAPPGSIRREFGESMMINAAHASDSPDNARKEMQILAIGGNSFRAVISGGIGPARPSPSRPG